MQKQGGARFDKPVASPRTAFGIWMASTRYSDAALPTNFSRLSQEYLHSRGSPRGRDPRRPSWRSEGLCALRHCGERLSVSCEP